MVTFGEQNYHNEVCICMEKCKKCDARLPRNILFDHYITEHQVGVLRGKKCVLNGLLLDMLDSVGRIDPMYRIIQHKEQQILFRFFVHRNCSLDPLYLMFEAHSHDTNHFNKFNLSYQIVSRDGDKSFKRQKVYAPKMFGNKNRFQIMCLDEWDDDLYERDFKECLKITLHDDAFSLMKTSYKDMIHIQTL